MLEILNQALWWVGLAVVAAGGFGLLAFIGTWSLERWVKFRKTRRAIFNAYAEGYRAAEKEYRIKG